MYKLKITQKALEKGNATEGSRTQNFISSMLGFPLLAS